ncbi:MAG: hypothetical protein IKZ82_08345 [Clostridia bacterium]|nr:hypothetical protein [Clostridia bacterium]
MTNPKSVKRVLARLKQRYAIERLVVIDSDKVIYSGDLVGFENAAQRNIVSYDYWEKIQSSTVINKFIHRSYEIYLFIGEVRAEVN